MIYLFIGAGSSRNLFRGRRHFFLRYWLRIFSLNMKNILIGFVLIVLVGLIPKTTFAEEADASAQLKTTVYSADEQSDAQYKVAAIKKVLSRYNSPLVNEAETFVVTARALNLDPYLLPSIAGVESGFGARYIKPTHNVFGYGVGRIPFDNFADGIARVGYALRFKYINKGAENLAQIGHRYAGGSTTWAPKVQNYINAFEREEKKLKTFFELIKILSYTRRSVML
ncbi:MAG: hypothetical protein UZ22_OP11002000551 [Microgenomates bacterium OLB23]|nr:MAG: hypothetical protein UZ22_OP11002000551 [Microgenomates bacterium OLB23]